jgi:Protein of unknown function (DUF3613)
MLTLLALLSLQASNVQAQQDAVKPAEPVTAAQPAPFDVGAETGPVTRRWLQAQRAREQSSAVQPTLSGPAMQRVHERYLKSFEQPIPNRLADDRPVSRSK